VFPVFYFGPVEYFAHLNRHEKVVFDQHEQFKKQSFRNRATVLGPNGCFNMLVPVHQRNHSAMTEVIIAEEEKWRKLHQKTLSSFYRNSSYFEYYEHHLDDFYTKDFKNLFELNLESTLLASKLLGMEFEFELSNSYFKSEEEFDFREHIHPKKKSTGTFESYHQVFQDRLPFQENLSILDLIFNLGPKAKNYLSTVL